LFIGLPSARAPASIHGIVIEGGGAGEVGKVVRDEGGVSEGGE
jgi:hypothetical protein